MESKDSMAKKSDGEQLCAFDVTTASKDFMANEFSTEQVRTFDTTTTSNDFMVNTFMLLMYPRYQRTLWPTINKEFVPLMRP